jgi:RNA polymerase sigma factor (sigma-70 family)
MLSIAEQQELVKQNIGIAHKVARRLTQENGDLNDAIQEACLGLVKAAKTYDGSTKFCTYAWKCAFAEVVGAWRRHNRGLRVDVPDELLIGEREREKVHGLALEDSVLIRNSVGSPADQEEYLGRKEEAGVVTAAIRAAGLTRLEMETVINRFWLEKKVGRKESGEDGHRKAAAVTMTLRRAYRKIKPKLEEIING